MKPDMLEAVRAQGFKEITNNSTSRSAIDAALCRRARQDFERCLALDKSLKPWLDQSIAFVFNPEGMVGVFIKGKDER